MGTTLTGTTPQDTYDSLIKVTDNGPLSGTAKYLSDGLGNDSVLALSTARVGVGTTTPTSPVDILGGASNGGLKVRAGSTTSNNILDIANNAGTQGFYYRAGDNVLQYYGYDFSVESQSSGGHILLNTGTGSGQVRINGASGARLAVRGSGTTAATTPLLVQNSAGTELLKVRDDNKIFFGGSTSNYIEGGYNFVGSYYWLNHQIFRGALTNDSGSVKVADDLKVGNNTDNDSSAVLQADSTTKGFLPPRMTTTEKNAISSPAAGLQVYDTDLNQMSYYNGTSWINI